MGLQRPGPLQTRPIGKAVLADRGNGKRTFHVLEADNIKLAREEIEALKSMRKRQWLGIAVFGTGEAVEHFEDIKIDDQLSLEAGGNQMSRLVRRATAQTGAGHCRGTQVLE